MGICNSKSSGEDLEDAVKILFEMNKEDYNQKSCHVCGKKLVQRSTRKTSDGLLQLKIPTQLLYLLKPIDSFVAQVSEWIKCTRASKKNKTVTKQI